MLRIFATGPWYSTSITAKYEYSTQNSFFCKIKACEKVRTVTPVDANKFYLLTNIHFY